MLGPRVRSLVTATIVAILVGMVAVQVLKQLGVTRWTVAVPPLWLAGAVTALLYARFAGLRSFFTVLGAGVLIVPAAFALQPGIRRLIVPNTSRSAPADPAAAGFRPAPIVLMVFDELPLVSLLDANRNIDPALYPNLSALARDGVWFRNATTVSDYTRWAVPAILTGRRARPDAVPTAADHPDTLFSFLGRTHRLEVIEAATGMCPRPLCEDPEDSLRRRFAGMGGDLSIVAAYVFLTPDLHERLQLPDLTANWGGFSAGADAGLDLSSRAWQRHVQQRFKDDRRRFAQAFIDGISASDQQPTLYFLHVLLPHQPWVLLPSGQRNSSLAPLPSAMRGVRRGDDWEIAQNQQRHLLQVGYVDNVVGRVVARLKEAGLYERALLVITADHGVAITKGLNVRGFTVGTAPEIMRVPLVIKFPAGTENPLCFQPSPRTASASAIETWRPSTLHRRLLRCSASGSPGPRMAHRCSTSPLRRAGRSASHMTPARRFSGTGPRGLLSTRCCGGVSRRSARRIRTASPGHPGSASSSATRPPNTASSTVPR